MRWNHVPLLSEALQEDQYRGVQKIGIWEKKHAIPMIVQKDVLAYKPGGVFALSRFKGISTKLGPAGERCQDP